MAFSEKLAVWSSAQGGSRDRDLSTESNCQLTPTLSKSCLLKTRAQRPWAQCSAEVLKDIVLMGIVAGETSLSLPEVSELG